MLRNARIRAASGRKFLPPGGNYYLNGGRENASYSTGLLSPDIEPILACLLDLMRC